MKLCSLIWLGIKNSYEKVSNFLNERFPGVWGHSSQILRKSSGVPTKKATEMVMEASGKVISAF